MATPAAAVAASAKTTPVEVLMIVAVALALDRPNQDCWSFDACTTTLAAMVELAVVDAVVVTSVPYMVTAIVKSCFGSGKGLLVLVVGAVRPVAVPAVPKTTWTGLTVCSELTNPPASWHSRCR